MVAGRRKLVVMLLLPVLLLAAPIPWLVPRDSSWGMAWRLDGRLTVNDQVVDPPGRWTWLTVGRPPLVIEVLLDDGEGMKDLRQGSIARRPGVSEPLAAAVGLLHAGRDISFGLMVEATGPDDSRYPSRAVVLEIEGVRITDRASWALALTEAGSPITFRTKGGDLYTAPGPGLPYSRVRLISVAPTPVEAAIGGGLASTPPISWFRGLALGRSHGLIVALATYAHASEHDLAGGRHLAATGAIGSDGSVGKVGGLVAKAEAARRVGADVLLFPSEQEQELAGFDAGGMTLLPVASLSAAISRLDQSNPNGQLSP